MKSKVLIKTSAVAIVAATFIVYPFTSVLAAPTSQFSQVINAGILSTDILDASRVPVASPAVALSAKTYSFSCLNAAASSTGTLGTNNERVYAINPGASNTGFTIDIAGSSAAALWTSGGNTYDFNDAGTAGCTDGADTDTKGGQMTVDPSVSTITTDCTACTVTGITKGGSTSFVEGTANSVNIINAGATSDDNLRVYLTGIALKQTIPAEQSTGTYTMNYTVSVTAQ